MRACVCVCGKRDIATASEIAFDGILKSTMGKFGQHRWRRALSELLSGSRRARGSKRGQEVARGGKWEGVKKGKNRCGSLGFAIKG